MPLSPPDQDSPPSPPADESAATEHLTHLPKMSPTAGVAATEYVAINATSIAALLLGMASILALMNSALSLIALAGVIVSSVSLRQIGGSNGTQTGRALALGGLFFSLAIGSFVASSALLQDWALRNDRIQIANLCDQFGKALNERRYDDAYAMFSMRFRSQISRVEFVTKLKGEQDGLDREAAAIKGAVGPIVAVTWNGLAEFNPNYDEGTYLAESGIQLHYKNTNNTSDLPAVFRKAGDTWMFETITQWLFETKQRA
jgi:hypothetical protein